MSIFVLDDITRDKIAAGEVVERPASVVKELVENSLDAGARRIEVRLDGAGDAIEIAVTDDGCGMSPDDLALCIHRHATSKIRTADDLWRISSYGFRGEALPSIAAVSKLEIRSRPAGSDVGHRIVVEASTVISSGEVPMPPGTAVLVRRLFFNTPVRARFLRSPRAELSRAVGLLERLALARPDVAFRCDSGGRLVLQTPGNGDQRETLLAIHGLDIAREVRVGRAVTPGGSASVTALVGSPATGRVNRQYQGVWINARPVSVKGLLDAAEAAYPFGVLPGRRHPLLYLMFELPTEDVDVNVHPAKLEVRLAGGSPVFALAAAALRDAAAPPSPHYVPASGIEPSPAASRPGSARATYPETGQTAWPQTAANMGGLAAGETAAAWELWATDLSALRPLGQVGRRWLVCDGPGGLFLLDQHAAHERVIFERLGEDGPAAQGSQTMAIPVAVELSPADFATWQAVSDVLAEMGLTTEHFGGTSVLVREVPQDLAHGGGGSPQSLLNDVLSALAEEEQRAAPLALRLRARQALASCTAAIKAHQQLASPELQGLLTQLAACREPWRCPHGRPTVVLISHDELARRFGRQ